MRWSIIGVTAVVLVGLTAAAWMLMAPPGARITAPTAPTDGVGQSDHDGDTQVDGGAPTPEGVDAPGGAPSPEATPVDGSEVLPPVDPTVPRGQLPQLPQPTPLIETPLPANASARGELVDGFPSAVAGPAPASDVLKSSISSDGTTMQAALTARTDAEPDAISAHYREVWSNLGLAPAAGDVISATDLFTSVTLAFTESGTGTVYTVFTTLRTE